MATNEIREQIVKDILGGVATATECAEKYGIPAGTIRSWVSRAKKKCNIAEKTGEKSATKKEAQRKTQRKAVQPSEPIIKIEDVSESLTEKERLFCWRYIHNFNATQSYIWAFQCKNYNVAGVEGHKLLKKPKIKEEIARLKKMKFEALQVTPDDIVERYMRIAFADMTDFVKFGQKEVIVAKTKEGEIIRDIDNYIDFKDHSMVDGGLICEIKKGKQGMSIKLEDRQKALDWLAKYFEINPMDKHKKEYDEKRLDLQKKELELKEKQLKNNEW